MLYYRLCLQMENDFDFPLNIFGFFKNLNDGFMASNKDYQNKN